jgi:hypothetical protein
MGYEAKGLPSQLPFEKSSQGWQLRVHIDPKVLNPDDSNNKISLIKHCVSEAFKDCAVEGKLFAVGSDEDGYDGAISSGGKDRTQLGKEVCIYLPDSNQEQMSSSEYQERVLTLWQLLQKNDIPLLHLNVPGDQMITIGDTNVPSPFSFTSENPYRAEWKDKHGILFKQFQAHGKHPVLDIKFSVDELSAAGIELSTSLEQSSEFLKKHQLKVQSNMQQELESINGQDSYQQFLNDDAKTKDVLKSVIRGSEGKNSADIRQILEKNEHYQRLRDYPHQTTSNFEQNHILDEIEARITRKQLTEADVDSLVDRLRQEYTVALADIVNDFKDHKITVGDYDIEELVNKNPQRMQVVFRQNALINQEHAQNSYFLNNKITSKDFAELMSSVDALITELDTISTNPNDTSLASKAQEFRKSLLVVQNQVALDQMATISDEAREEMLKNHAEKVGNVISQHADGLIREPSVSNFFRSILNACIRVINKICSQNISEFAYTENENVPASLKERLNSFKEESKSNNQELDEAQRNSPSSI